MATMTRRFIRTSIFGMIGLLAAGLGLAQFPRDAVAQAAPKSALVGESSSVQRMNEWTVGLAGGLLEGTFIRFAAEIGKVLDDPPNLRILPVVSYGAVGNVEDLLYLKGIDVAITQADVLDHFKREGKNSNIADRIHYIIRFFLSEVHIYARPEIKTIEDLAGKKVSFNTVGSAANLTGGIIFDRLGVKADRVFMNNSLALEKMRSGEIAAVVHVVGKPNELFSKFKPEPGFHFLPIEYTDKFADYYVPIELTNEDYPNLIAKGEKVDSIGVSTVLAVYNWPKESDRYRRVTRFIEQLFVKFEQFQKPPFQPKWKEINLAATVPGWKRYAVSEELLARMKPIEAPAAPPAPAPAPAAATKQPVAEVVVSRNQFEAFVAQRARSVGKTQLTDKEREVLFKEYRSWLEKESAKPR
jgi:TRAP-type uncharacterized transport system substrate-binding protein